MLIQTNLSLKDQENITAKKKKKTQTKPDVTPASTSKRWRADVLQEVEKSIKENAEAEKAKAGAEKAKVDKKRLRNRMAF